MSDNFITNKIRNSTTCKILAYACSNDYNQLQKSHHLQLLSGIIGEKISDDKLGNSSYITKKNGATLTVYFGSHANCKVTCDDVNLLLLFLPVNQNVLHASYSEKVRNITATQGRPIWKKAVIILTGIEVNSYSHIHCQENVVRTKALLDSWKGHLQQATSSTEVQVLLAGRQDQPDLPNPHQKWFSRLCFCCFKSLDVEAMPAMLKFVQNRIANNISSSAILTTPFHQQHIEVRENSVNLPKSTKVALGIGGGGAITGAAAAGATTGALIGALAIGIPSFGLAAGLGLLIGGLIGGGAGAGIASAAVGGAYAAARNQQQQEIPTQDLRTYYAELLCRLPRISAYLTEWTARQVNCRIVVAGIRGEGVSTLAAAIVGQNPQPNMELYENQMEASANLVVQDFPNFKNDADLNAKARQLTELMKNKHLLVFCVPMTSCKETFKSSSHAKYLQRLCNEDRNILSNTVIALTHANEMCAAMEGQEKQPQTTFQQYFGDEVKEWKAKIMSVLAGCTVSNHCDVDKVPIIPAGNVKPSIDLSENRQPSPATQCHWRSELLLYAMQATKPEGVPTLIRINERRIQKLPNEYCDLNQIHKPLIVEARCSMFSKVGLRDKKKIGEAIGLIHGVNDKQKI